MSPRSRAFDQAGATLDGLYSCDASMQACLNRARLAAQTDLPILILGESGSGKTILARAIHNSSQRRNGPFVSFNAAALSETLLDSQLFGHERGAFTGAQQRVKGKFELADSGTLFLDEVGDLTAAAQAKILRAVETGEFERLGLEVLRQADVRIVSATHYRIDQPASPARVRDDLFFRISGITVVVPPLRERPGDLPTLLANEVKRAADAHGKSIIGLDKIAADRLLTYRWPGNLRELSSVIHAAVALTPGEIIGMDALVLLEETAVADGRPAATRAPDSRLLADAVHRHVTGVLEALGGNKRRAARELGIGRGTLERKLRAPRKRR